MAAAPHEARTAVAPFPFRPMKSPILALGCALLALTSIVRSAESAKPAFLDCYVSTGDNHFLGSSLPIDSPASIEATFDLFKNVNRVRRVYWRGLEEASWLATMQARPENPRYHSLWTWLEQLYAEVQPDQLAVKAAHARGMEIWGVGSLWDWGAQADTPTFGDYPFPFESKLRLAHPEWAPANKFGTRRQGGPIELAYPEARRALVELTVQETLKAGYDGITFLTYVENYSMRYQDEFGYSEPIVRDFKKLHGIDITKEPFKRGATREDWLRLRGRYITAFLRELRAALQPHGVKLGMIINGNDPHSPLTWNVPEIMMTAGAHHLDIETWVREGLVDALCVYGNVAPGAQEKALADLRFLSRGTDVEVSFMTSGPFAERWNAAHQERVPCVLAISDDTQHLARGYVAVQTAEALRSADLWSRLRALGQIIDGELIAPPAEIIPLAKSANLIERRMALQALGKTGAKLAEAVLPTLTDALDDPENGVRCMAALALGQVRDPRSAAALLSAVEKRGNHMLMECAVIALRRLQPLPAADLAKSLTAHASGRVRQAAIRSLMPFGPKDQLPAFSSALDDSDRFTRFAAAEALGNIGKSPDAANRLLLALDHADPAVANRAAVSLGVIALRREPELTALRSKMLAALEARFQQYARPQPPADADWGYRPVGNALLDFGDEGGAVLKKLRDQRENPALAELAWRVLDLRQAKNTFSEADPQSDDAAHARRPTAAALEPARSLRVDPVGGNDAHDGRTQPVKTIARGIKLAQPGDTIHLAPARYRESADLSNKRGEPGRPIILDGHGAVLDGAESLRPEDWPMVAPGLYRCDRLTTINGAILGRWFFVFDGKMSHMGRTSKGPSTALKSPEELAPGEWTYVPDAAITRETKDGKPWDSVPRAGAFYVKIDPAKPLAEARIEAPIRSSGVVLSGKSAHLVIRNVIATHVHNDGFNIHGDARDLIFENIAAIECGDDGFSAHETAECRIDGFVSIGNSTGLCDTVSSVTHFKNVFIKDCLGYDVFFIGDSPHSIENALIESRAARAVEVSQHGDRPQAGLSSVVFKNVLIRRADSPQEIRVNKNSKLQAERCTFVGLNVNITPGGAMSAKQCVFSGEPKPGILLFPNTIWQGEGNRYDLGSLRVDKTSFTAANFADFQKLMGTDKSSQWSATDPVEAGADELALRRVKAAAKEVVSRWRSMLDRKAVDTVR